MCERLFSELVSGGCFGDMTFDSLCLTEGAMKDTNYSSIVKFMTITCKNNDSMSKIDVVVKTQLLQEKDREIRDCDQMFVNETDVYQLLLPKIYQSESDLFPKLYYGVATNGLDVSRDVILLENLFSKGFSHTQDVFMDLSHIQLSICKLAKFHSLTYSFRLNDPDSFKTATQNMKETWFRDDLPKNIKSQSLTALKRGILPLIDKGLEKNLLLEFLNSFDNLFEVVRELKKPSKAFGVVCHGDFIGSNILFKYENGIPVDLRIIDLQNALYSSPIIDLATFLYTHTTKRMRQHYWDSFLDLYWNEFVSNLSENVTCPDKEGFFEEFSERAVYAYIPCSFCVPMMLKSNEIQMESYSGSSEEEKNNLVMLSGGDLGTQAAMDIVLHMLEKSYVKKFLKSSIQQSS